MCTLYANGLRLATCCRYQSVENPLFDPPLPLGKTDARLSGGSGAGRRGGAERPMSNKLLKANDHSSYLEVDAVLNTVAEVSGGTESGGMVRPGSTVRVFCRSCHHTLICKCSPNIGVLTYKTCVGFIRQVLQLQIRRPRLPAVNGHRYLCIRYR